MLHAHYRTVAFINQNQSMKYLIRDYFSLPKWQALMPALIGRGLGQADLVLALLRLRDRHGGPTKTACDQHIAALVGHPIVVCPACLRDYRTGPTRVTKSRDDRRILFTVHDNPRQPGTEAYLRWCEYRVGRSLGQLYVRGVKKRDVRRAISRGWIKVEEMVA